jgi:hypothetical protein
VRDEDLPDFKGPYRAEDNGVCTNGHPLNGFGRCARLNDPNDECKPEE